MSVAYQDKETNLHYNYFRDYDPAIGRYVQADPIGLSGGINLYAYVDSNPLSYTDPLGLQRKKPPIKVPSTAARDAFEQAAEMTGLDMKLYDRICLEAECIDNCGNKYRIVNWIPTRPTLKEIDPNCTCIESIWPRKPNFWLIYR